MRSLVWEAPNTMRVRSAPDPRPGPNDALVDVSFVGICGSDIGGYLGHNALRVPPLVMGHEFSGTIVELGTDVDRTLSVGQRVTCNPMLSCGTCAYCQKGLPHLCVARALVGAHLPGAFAEYCVVPADALVVLPEHLSVRDGALVEPAAVAVRIVSVAGEAANEDCLVVGAGPIGLLAIQMLHKRHAARVFVSDIDPARLEMAKSLGAIVIDARAAKVADVVRAQTGGLGAAISVDAVGSRQTRGDAIAATRAAGRVILSGLHEEASVFPAADVIRREIAVCGAFCYTPTDFSAALRLIVQGDLSLDPWIVEAPLEAGGDWFARLSTKPGDVSKVLLVP